MWEGGRLTVGATQRDKEKGVRRERERHCKEKLVGSRGWEGGGSRERG